MGEGRRWSPEVFTACLFIGLGVGMLFDEAGAGVILGMGVGFILASIVRVRGEFSLRVPREAGAASLTVVGVGFIVLGLWMLGLVTWASLRVVLGMLAVAVGVLLLFMVPVALRRRGEGAGGQAD